MSLTARQKPKQLPPVVLGPSEGLTWRPQSTLHVCFYGDVPANCQSNRLILRRVFFTEETVAIRQ